MKRNERTIYNRLRKEVTPDTINVEIPVDYTHEGRQAIHELLTIEKGFYVTGINWNSIEECYCIHYDRAYTETAENIKQEQEAADIDSVTADMVYSDWTWNGYHKPTEAPQTTDATTPAENATQDAAQDPATVYKKEIKTALELMEEHPNFSRFDLANALHGYNPRLTFEELTEITREVSPTVSRFPW